MYTVRQTHSMKHMLKPIHHITIVQVICRKGKSNVNKHTAQPHSDRSFSENQRKTAAMFSYRADVERQDKDDEEAEVPGQQRSQQDHPLLLPQISIAVEEVQGQEENDHDHDSQRSATHSDE